MSTIGRRMGRRFRRLLNHTSKRTQELEAEIARLTRELANSKEDDSWSPARAARSVLSERYATHVLDESNLPLQQRIREELLAHFYSRMTWWKDDYFESMPPEYPFLRQYHGLRH